MFGVEEVEALEGTVEQSADAGVQARARGPSGQLLLVASLLEGGACGVDLLGGDVLAVEVDAGAPAAIGTGAVVEGARPGLRDEPEDLCGELTRGGGTQVEGRRGLTKEAEAPFDVGLVLGPWRPAVVRDLCGHMR
jgi:hypothetical protein